MSEDKQLIVRESTANPAKLVYATDEWRRGVFGYERVWTTDETKAKEFTAAEVAREEQRERERQG